MAWKAGTIYIKADRNVEVAKTSVMIGDVLKIECTDPAMLARIRSIHLLTFHHPDDKRQRRTEAYWRGGRRTSRRRSRQDRRS